VSSNHISECGCRLAEALAREELSSIKNKTAAINLAVREALERREISTEIEMPEPAGSLEDQLKARLHREAVEYVRLRTQVTGKRSGTYAYRDLKWYGPVKTLERYVMLGSSEGLRFLAEQDRLDLAAENAAIDPAYESLIPAEVRKKAQENLDEARRWSSRRRQ
jgi:hypothetical protein